jgi:hypothetical protein
MIDIAQALQHPTEDQDWIKKFALGVLISFVPILSFAVTGFIIEHLQNSARGASSPLPNWDNLGKKLVTGLKLLAVQLIFALPILVPSCALLGFVIQQTASRPGENLPENAVLIVGIGGIALSCVALLYGLFLLYLSAAIPIQFARTEQIGACLRVGELIQIARTNTGDYLTIVAIVAATSFAVGLVSGILSLIPCLGTVIVIVIALLSPLYIGLVVANMAGQYVHSNNIVWTPIWA